VAICLFVIYNYSMIFEKPFLYFGIALLLMSSFGGSVNAQSKFLFNPGVFFDGPFRDELSGAGIMVGLEYRPKTYFGIEAKLKYGFYSFSRSLSPENKPISGVYHPNGYFEYRLQTPQLSLVPRIYKDLDVFYDGLFLFAESEFSLGLVNGRLDISGDTSYEKSFSETISYYSVSVGLEYQEDNSHNKKRDWIAAGSFGFSSWDLKEQLNRHIPDFYDGPTPVQKVTFVINLVLKIPIGTKLGG